MSSEHVINWRRNIKEHIIACFNGKCGICGYNKCNRALQLHHLNPEEKDFQISGSTRGWNKLAEEAKKCVMLCSNCRTEIHEGIIEIPKDIQRFDESLRPETFHESFYNECPVCRGKKKKRHKHCSLSCSGKAHQRVDWDNVDLEEMMKTMSRVQIGKLLGVTDNAVRKRQKKLGLIT